MSKTIKAMVTLCVTKVAVVAGFVFTIMANPAHAASTPKGFVNDTMVVNEALCESISLMTTALTIDGLKNYATPSEMTSSLATGLLVNEVKDKTSWAMFAYMGSRMEDLHSAIYSNTARLNWLSQGGSMYTYPDGVGLAAKRICRGYIGSQINFVRPINGIPL